MKPPIWTTPQEMEWHQGSAGKSEYALWAGEDQVATLQSSGWFTTTREGETEFGDVTISTKGFLSQSLAVADSTNPAPLLTSASALCIFSGTTFPV